MTVIYNNYFEGKIYEVPKKDCDYLLYYYYTRKLY